MGTLFGTDGIRGEANRPPVDGPTGFALGRSLVKRLESDGTGDRNVRVVLGRDTRISGDMLESALASGIASAGGDVLRVEVLPTPGVAFLTRALNADAGVMISASHNPYRDNGFKVFSSRGTKLSVREETSVEEGILNDPVGRSTATPVGDPGRIQRLEDAGDRYIAFLRDTFPRGLTLKGVRMVLDTANGAACRIAPAVFQGLGADVDVINDQPDGRNINEACGSEHTEGLSSRVRGTGAHLGLALDGDGDRLIAVDASGQRLTGDQVLMILAAELHKQGALAGDLLVTTVMSNLGLTEACRRMGLRHHASAVGDRFVLEDMQRLGAVLGGEESGHMIFLNHHTTGDGILSGLQLLACMVRNCAALSNLASVMEVFPQSLVNVEVSHKPDIQTLPGVVRTIRDVESELGEKGRVLVRYSGTQKMCRVMVEGPNDTVTQRAAHQIADAVREAIG